MEIRITIDDRVVSFVKGLARPSRVRVLGGLAMVGVALAAYGVSKPYSFTDGTVISAAQVNANFDTAYNQITDLANVNNIRALLSKSTANTFCASYSAVAIHTPWSYRGKSGTQICAADSRGKSTCAAVKYIYVTNANGYGSYPTNDVACTAGISTPWPWGRNYDAPNTLDAEWGHGDTYVVCCK